MLLLTRIFWFLSDVLQYYYAVLSRETSAASTQQWTTCTVAYVFYSTFEVRQGQTAVLSFFSFGSEFYGCCTDKSVK